MSVVGAFTHYLHCVVSDVDFVGIVVENGEWVLEYSVDLGIGTKKQQPSFNFAVCTDYEGS